MKERTGASNEHGAVSKGGFNGQYSKNKQRLGGRGLSLHAFANAKSRHKNDYNLALIKRQREFYKNAKLVKKFKKSLKHENDHQDEAPLARTGLQSEETNEAEEAPKFNRNNKKDRKNGFQSLEEVFAKKREEEEKARIEKEAYLQAKKDEKLKAEERRKSLKGKMFKKTRSGQPVMKYRIEHILETLQGSSS